MQPAPRIAFANLLRGLACALVVTSHCCGFWAHNHGSTNITHLVSLEGYQPAPETCANLGRFVTLFSHTPNFGVLLFFLISGFVIPLSLEKIGPGPFLVQRCFRLFPTYWGALAMIIATLVAARLWIFDLQPALPFDFWQVVHNAFLTKDFAWEPSIELGIWTLLVEIKFYLLAAFVYSLRREWRYPATLALVCCGCALMLGHFNRYNELFATSRYFFFTVTALTNAIPFLTYMLLGVVAQQYWSRKLAVSETIALTVGIYGLWLYLFTTTQFGLAQFWEYFLPSLYAATAFGICLGCQQAWNQRSARKPAVGGRTIRWGTAGLEFLANISYPLYLVHGTLGYAIFCLFWQATHSAAASATLGLGLVVAVATGLHYAVERPSIRWGKWLSEFVPGATRADCGESITIDPTLVIPPPSIRRRSPRAFKPYPRTDAA